MRQSRLFTKTRKEAPSDEVARNAELLIRAGFIHKEMAGVYSLLPLGLLVMNRIARIIREEMDAIGGEEVLLSALQNPRVWKESGRFDDRVVDNWFKSELKGGGEVGIANTHEEPLTKLLAGHVSSYKDLPRYIYQIQAKFRNELRAKSGMLRGREFLMKDLYSFSRTEEEFREFYETCAAAYGRIFERAGFGGITYRTAAGGGSFTSGFTDEFQVVTPAGEDTIYVDEKEGRAINREIYTEENARATGLCTECLVEKRAVEVGNIFPLGTRFSDALGLRFTDERGKKQPVVMGSYGIGLGRLMGTIVEVFSDERGIVWPRSVAPFQAHLLLIPGSREAQRAADRLYAALCREGIAVLYDDRAARAGEKFADADLIGIPSRLVVSGETLSGGTCEVKDRASGRVSQRSEADVVRMLRDENDTRAARGSRARRG